MTAAKSDNNTEKVIVSLSVITKLLVPESIAKETMVVFVSESVSLKALKSTLTLPPFSKSKVNTFEVSLNVKPVNCWSSDDVNSQESPSQKKMVPVVVFT